MCVCIINEKEYESSLIQRKEDFGLNIFINLNYYPLKSTLKKLFYDIDHISQTFSRYCT